MILCEKRGGKIQKPIEKTSPFDTLTVKLACAKEKNYFIIMLNQIFNWSLESKLEEDTDITLRIKKILIWVFKGNSREKFPEGF